MSGTPHVTRMVLTFKKQKSKRSANLCKSVQSVDKKTAEPMAFEDIPIGPERTDLAFLALNIQSLSMSHKHNCEALGHTKSALLNAQNDDPAVMDIIQRIILTPPGHRLHELADQLFYATTKG